MPDNAFIFGGAPTGGSYTDRIEKFDPAAETWSTLAATLNNSCGYHGSGETKDASDDYYISIFNGYNLSGYIHSNDLFVIDTETITARQNDSGVSGYYYHTRPGNYTGSQAFVQGGKKETTTAISRDQRKYDTFLDVWVELVDLDKCSLNAASINVHTDDTQSSGYEIYGSRSSTEVGGGALGNEVNYYEFFWGQVAAVVADRSGTEVAGSNAVAIDDEHGILAGGWSSTQTESLCEKLTLLSYAWTTKTSMTNERAYSGIFRSPDQNSIYVIGGYSTQSSDRLDTLLKYNVSGDSWGVVAGGTTSQKCFAVSFGTNYTTVDWEQASEISQQTFEPLDRLPHVAVSNGSGSFKYPSFSYTVSGDILLPTDGKYDEATSGLSGYNNEYRQIISSKLTVAVESEYSASGNREWFTILRDASYYFHLFKTTDKKAFTMIFDFQSEFVHDSSCRYCIDVNGKYLYICYSTTSGEPSSTKGLMLMKYDTTTNSIVWKSQINSAKTALINFCYTIDKDDSNNHIVTYNGDVTGTSYLSYQYSTDGGSTWSAVKNLNSIRPLNDNGYTWDGDITVHHYNYINQRIEMLVGSDLSGSKGLHFLYFNWDSEKWQWEYYTTVECSGGSAKIPSIDAVIDQNSGIWYGISRINWCDNQHEFFLFKIYDDLISVNYYEESLGLSGTDTSDGTPQFGIMWNENCWVGAFHQYVNRDPNDDTRPIGVANSLFFKTHGDKSFLSSFDDYEFYQFDSIDTSPHNRNVGPYGSPIVFNMIVPYADPYSVISTAGIDVLLYLPIVKGSDRKPATGNTVTLRNESDDTLYIVLTEHSTYKGLYYGTIDASFDVYFVDIYVDGNKLTNFSPISVVPTDRWLSYAQTGSITDPVTGDVREDIKQGIHLWTSVNKPVGSDQKVTWKDTNGNEFTSVRVDNRGNFVTEFKNSKAMDLYVDDIADSELEDVSFQGDDIIPKHPDA